MAFFEGNKMTGGYGNGPDIINSCSVNVDRGEIVSILGPNGAGKSTAMKAMLGLLNLKSGSVIINGKDISKLSPQDRVKEGISFVPQTKNVFAGMTVEENLEMGAFLINNEFKETIEEIFNLFPILKEKKDQINQKKANLNLCKELWEIYQDFWCEHKPSVTISVKEHEWLNVGSWVYDNFDDVAGVSFLPFSDHSYKQAPYQDCGVEEYEELLAKMPTDVDWSELSAFEKGDTTAGSQTMACSAGSCEVVDLTSEG